MKILCTFPGRNGDLLWALPVIRAISQHCKAPVGLQIGGEFTGIVPLLQRQPYLSHVWADSWWSLTPPEEWRAPGLSGYDNVFHCGYRGWPEQGLPFWVAQGVKGSYPELANLEVDYDSPWITIDGPGAPCEIAMGWSDEWFELKAGIVTLIGEKIPPYTICAPAGSRWRTERPRASWCLSYETDWVSMTAAIRNSDLFVGCCSAPHVLAVALGKPVVIMEPSQARWNPIFYPFGMDGPRVTVVKGNDGQPTHDARHVAETIERVLHETH